MSNVVGSMIANAHLLTRDIPLPLVTSGCDNSGNLRELALNRMKDFGAVCRDVRYREVGVSISAVLTLYSLNGGGFRSTRSITRCDRNRLSFFEGIILQTGVGKPSSHMRTPRGIFLLASCG